MTTVVITARVDDSAKWEQGFQTHKELFGEYTATAISYKTTNENEVAILWQVDDVDKFLALIDTPATAEAMSFDGVQTDTVSIFVLDKELDL